MSKLSVRRMASVTSTLATLIAGGYCSLALASNADTTRSIHIESGELQGKVVGRVDEFLGIPYAAPPVGDLRWRPPATPVSWNGTRQATAFANTCAQPPRGIFASPSNTEDCLYLNVFAPHASQPEAKRPVMVWFYGGGLFSGESNDYDGTKLVERGNVIVVTLNYRVGALGFLSLPAFNGEGHPYANYGIMDQQAALRWVKKNIAQFGGDPNKVTIFGQSAGGTSVLANMQSPVAKGLFQRAIVESGTRIKVISPEFALKAGEAFAKGAGCADNDAACLRHLSLKQIFDSQKPIYSYVTEFPSVDGTIITDNAPDAFRTGNYNHVPTIAGLVEDEESYFVPEVLFGAAPLTKEGYDKYLNFYGSAHTAVAEKYTLSKFENPTFAEIAVAQGLKACTTQLLDKDWSKTAPVYAYEFRDRTAPSYYPPKSFSMRAYHTSELQYLFPLFHGGRGTPHPLDAEQERLSDLMVDYWTSFARDGIPKAQSGDLTSDTWAKYSPAADNVQFLDLTGGHQHPAYGKMYDCSFWDAIIPAQLQETKAQLK